MPANIIKQLTEEASALLQQSQLTRAEALFEQICDIDKTNANAWMMRGSINSELGKTQEAVSQLRKAVSLDDNLGKAHFVLARNLQKQGDMRGTFEGLEKCIAVEPDNAAALNMLGMIYAHQGNHGNAADYFRQAVACCPKPLEYQMNFAHALLQSHEYQEAAKQYNDITRRNPGNAVAWLMLGRSLAEADQLEEATGAFRKALEIKPEFPQASHGLGYALLRLGRWSESISYFQSALGMNPRMPLAHFGLGSSLQLLGNLEAALKHYREAVMLDPGHIDAHIGIGTVLSLMGKQDQAVETFREVIRLSPERLDTYIKLAASLLPLRQHEEALGLTEYVLERDPANIEAISLATTMDQHTGDLHKAQERIKPLLGVGANKVNVALAYATICSSLDDPDPAIAAIRQLLEKEQSITAASRINLHFSIGKLYDKKQEYAMAFEHYRRGNDLKESTFDPRQHSAVIDTIIATHTPEVMAALPRATTGSNRPIFVVGMPRSGTSLVEQILASHPAIFGAGELPYIIQLAGSFTNTTDTRLAYPQVIPGLSLQKINAAARHYLEQISMLSSDAKYVVDKMPGNFIYLGLIELMFPQSRIIHCIRDPLDTCLSCYFQNFSRSHPYSYDLSNLGSFYKDYARLMKHWRSLISIPVLDVQYEEMIADQEKGSKRIVDFCSLDWDDKCLDFYNTRRYVATASYDQVRRPMYKTSVSRWKNYPDFIDPLREALE